jgi:AcrR family transcriptional regulator
MGAENSHTRAELIRAAEAIISDQGYAAVTARALAEKVGLKRQIVHYYFHSIEELLIEVIRTHSDAARVAYGAALNAGHPLEAIRALNNNEAATALMFELQAMAVRKERVRTLIGGYVREFRQLQAEALERYLNERGLVPNVPPVVMALVMASLSSTLAAEVALGASEGHRELEALIDAWIEDLAKSGEMHLPVAHVEFAGSDRSISI